MSDTEQPVNSPSHKPWSKEIQEQEIRYTYGRLDAGDFNLVHPVPRFAYRDQQLAQRGLTFAYEHSKEKQTQQFLDINQSVISTVQKRGIISVVAGAATGGLAYLHGHHRNWSKTTNVMAAFAVGSAIALGGIFASAVIGLKQMVKNQAALPESNPVLLDLAETIVKERMQTEPEPALKGPWINRIGPGGKVELIRPEEASWAQTAKGNTIAVKAPSR